MKYLILILISLFSITFLGGCTQQHITSGTVTSGEMCTGGNTNSSEDEILTGNILSGSSISGAIYPIIISGNKLLYSGLFSIKIPKYLQKRTYEKRPFELLSFSNDSDYKNFVVSIGEQLPQSESGDNKSKCTYTYRAFPQPRVSLTTKMKMIEDTDIYITQAVFSGFNNNNHTQLCFIRNNIMHKIGIGNYDIVYIQGILNSFRLF